MEWPAGQLHTAGSGTTEAVKWRPAARPRAVIALVREAVEHQIEPLET